MLNDNQALLVSFMKQKSIYYLVTGIILLIAAMALYAGAVIVDFRGEPGAGKVTLYWSTLSETNCKGFQIERSLNKSDFKKIGFVEGMGSSAGRRNYEYVDKTVFKSQTDRTFYYRIRVLNLDETESAYSEIVAVTPSISGARYTWGSIKAMFR